MPKEMRRYLKPLGTRSEILHGYCKVHEKCVDGCCFSDGFYLLYKNLDRCLQDFQRLP